MARCSHTEEQQILKLVAANNFNTKISKEQALEVARILNEEVDMEKLNLQLNYGNGKVILNSWMNMLRYQRILRNNEPSPLTGLATKIAAETVQSATTDEERARGQRETNAARALGRGDIDGAFRSLNYFLDR
jgi:hypothetical protein